jgi:uroporphyrinogen decarboxylase
MADAIPSSSSGRPFKPGGGYVFNNVHNIQAGVPPENVVAMYDAALEFGFYD